MYKTYKKIKTHGHRQPFSGNYRVNGELEKGGEEMRKSHINY